MNCRLGLAFVLGTLLASGVSGEQVNENQMKAAYLYNFAKFVEWPSETFKNARDPIVICVLGQEALFQTLEEALSGETIEDRKLVVRRVSDGQQATRCQILFVGSTDLKNLRSILRDLKGPGILTLGETEDFTAEGGVANLRLEGKKIGIEINLSAAERQQLRISPKLLSLARIVKK
jgi:uncharacterized protein DUF4154